jgi:cation diffusion facilitator family transporter
MMMKSLNHEKRTLLVVILTAVTMIVEIVFGMLTGSMLLLADGIHMLSHTGALGLSWIAYILVRRYEQDPGFTRGTGKILDLSGYTSGLFLLVFAGVIIYESVRRLVEPISIQYTEAIIVACIGLAVNLVSAWILHHKESDHDQNLKAAYLHVLADALTSLTAIAGLVIAKIWDFPYIDAIGGIISSFIIIRWSYGLLRRTALSILDYSGEKIKKRGGH